MQNEKCKVQNKNAWFVVAAVAVAILIVSQQPGENNDIPAPTKYRSVVQPIVDTRIAAGDAEQLAEFYLAIADRIEADKAGKINSLDVLAKTHGDAGIMAFQGTPVYKSHSDLTPLVNDAIAAGAGSEKTGNGEYKPVEINSKNRGEIADAFRAVAWACKEK